MKYVCPMHSEVKSNKPGKCSKCGMELLEKSSISKKTPDNLNGSYLPLILIIFLIFILSLGISLTRGVVDERNLIESFMASFFIIFAFFKLKDLKGFAEGYSNYDLLAQKFYGYGYIYPFIELFFGIVMILGIYPRGILVAELIVMTFSGFGVLVKLLKREKFQCVCLGTSLKVPLTTITLVEDFGMAALALYLLLT